AEGRDVLVGEDALDLGCAEAGALAEEAVVLPLVLALPLRGDGEDDHLRLPSCQGAEGHQPAGEVEPAREEARRAAERGEDRRRLGAGDPAGCAGEAPADRAEVADGPRGDAGRHAGSFVPSVAGPLPGCSVV